MRIKIQLLFLSLLFVFSGYAKNNPSKDSSLDSAKNQ